MIVMKDHLYLQKDGNLALPKVQIGLDLILDLLQLNLLLHEGVMLPIPPLMQMVGHGLLMVKK